MRPFNLNTSAEIKNALSHNEFCLAVNDGDGPLVVQIDGVIGESFMEEGITATSVVDLLDADPARDVTVRINSPGGAVYDGFRIYNALLMHEGHVTTVNEGLAGSSAANIFMAGDTRKMMRVSDFHIHRSLGGAFGNAKTMRAVAEWLDTIDSHLIDDLYSDLGQSREQVEMWLDGSDNDGTPFNATQAVELGFAHELVDPPRKEPRESDTLKAAKSRINTSLVAKIEGVRRRNLTGAQK